MSDTETELAQLKASHKALYAEYEMLRNNIPVAAAVYLDLGCGTRKRVGCIGLDFRRLPGVDVIWLGGALPYDDGTVDGVFANMLLEHVEDVPALMQEVYRVCKSGVVFEFTVPYYQSVTQFKDPTHKTIIPPEMMRYFSDDKWYGSDYGFGVNFDLMDVRYTYLPPFDRINRLMIFYPLILLARRFLWNVVHSATIRLKVVK